jgi:hypothetical protein
MRSNESGHQMDNIQWPLNMTVSFRDPLSGFLHQNFGILLLNLRLNSLPG